jgi:hypothetical protein
VKIRTVTYDSRKKAFEVVTRGKRYSFPYAKLPARHSCRHLVKRVYVDDELAGEAFTYELASGEEGTVHLDEVLQYNGDPRYQRDILLYKLTLLAQQRVKSTLLSKRELIRRLKTSPAQFYRLLDQTNYAKSIDQLMALLAILDCQIDLVVRRKPRHARVPTGVS